MTAFYAPKVTGRNHYAFQKEGYNPSLSEAVAFFNITELVGTFLTVGRRVIRDTFTRLSSEKIVTGTLQQLQRQAMVRKYRHVAIQHGVKVPPLDKLVAYRRADKKLASYFSIIGQLSYFCHEELGREVTYGDLSYIIHPLSAAEREELGAHDHATVFSVFMEWCQQARIEAAGSAAVMTNYLASVKKTRTGRDGSEEVLVTAARYSASTVFNRAKAWQLVAAAHANSMGVALEDLQQQQLRGSADNKVDAAALAECKRRYDYAIGRLDAGGNIIRAADARKKAEARKTSSLATKTARQRLDMYTGAWYGQRVQDLGEWLLLALHTYVPPLRRAMYMDLDVHDVVWDTDVNTWCIMVGHFFKTSKTASIDRVLLVESLVDPMAIYLRHRHVLNKGVGTAPAHAADANRALFVNKNRRRHSGTSMTGAFREV